MRAPALAVLAAVMLFAAPPPALADNGSHRPQPAGDPKSDIGGSPPPIYVPQGGTQVNEPSQNLTNAPVEKFTDPYGRYSRLDLPDTPVGADYGQGSGRGTVEGSGSGGLSSGLTPLPPDDDEPPPPPIRRPPQQPAQKTQPGVTAGANTQSGGPGSPQDSGAAGGPVAAAAASGAPAPGAQWGSAKGSGASAAPGGESSTSKQAVGKAVKDAAAMIEGFKSREGGMGDLGGAGAHEPGGMAAAGAGGRAGGAGAAAAQDPAAQLAQSAGVYRDAFAAQGLRPAVGPDGRTVLLRSDGAQATPADLAALRARIDREPRLLASDPNLYRTISRERYGALQDAYQTRPELHDTSFKDVGMTEDKKDFLYTKSCEPVGGDCNKAAKAAYKKDKPVTADELERIWESVDAEAKAEEADFNTSKLTGSGIRGLASALQGMLGFGSRSAPPPPGGVFAGGAEHAGAAGSPRASAAGGARQAASAARAPRASDGDPPGLSLAAAALPGRGSGRALAALLGLAGLLLLAAALRARRA